MHAVLDDALIFVRRLDQLTALVNVVRAGLLDIHVLARLAGPDGGQRVPVVGRGDGHRVDLFVIEDAPQVLFDADLLAVGLFESRGALSRHQQVGVAQRHEFHVALFHQARDVVLAAPVDAQHRDPDAIVGPERAGRGELRYYGGARPRQKCSSAVHAVYFS